VVVKVKGLVVNAISLPFPMDIYESDEFDSESWYVAFRFTGRDNTVHIFTLCVDGEALLLYDCKPKYVASDNVIPFGKFYGSRVDDNNELLYSRLEISCTLAIRIDLREINTYVVAVEYFLMYSLRRLSWQLD